MMPQGPEEMRQAIVRNLPEKTGRGLEEWVRMVKAAVPEGGMNEKVAWLRSEHDLGMGTARVIASAAEGEKGYFSELPGKLLSDQYAGAKAGLMPVYRKLAQAAKELGRDVSLDPRKTYVSVSRDKQFAVIQASTAGRVDLGLALADARPGERLLAAGSFGPERITCRVALSSADEVDGEVIGWLRAAYEATKE